MSSNPQFKFNITKKLDGTLARAGEIHTPNGVILTPSFVTVGTKATVKSLSPEQVRDLGAQVVLANTYHLYLEPGDKIVADHGGFANMMNWRGPTMTDSGGFQAFSLGVAYGGKLSKFIASDTPDQDELDIAYGENSEKKAKITEDGVEFKSIKDGSLHFFSPEKSMEIQHNLGADIILAFDECTSPHATKNYLREAMQRTHRWAKRCLDFHNNSDKKNIQALYGIVQGGRYEDLRRESATIIGAMDFEGFGIGGSFVKEDMSNAVRWVNEILPENKPRHLLGVGEPIDLFLGVENGCDTFDCVAATRIARNGGLYTTNGKINILNAEHKTAMVPIEQDCGCYACKNYTRAYVAHLFRCQEMFGATLASIHNLFFINKLVADIRQSLLDETFFEFKEEFLKNFYKKNPA